MGGCRCVFRGCNVNSSHYPQIHFFHFPVKNPDRLKKWVEMSGRPEILKLTIAQQKNRVVCARHFQDDNFMNYLKAKLDKNAVPTLTRLGPTLAMDFENIKRDGLPRLVKLEPPTMKHLIPPPVFHDSLQMDCEVDEKKQAHQLISEGKLLPMLSESKNYGLSPTQRESRPRKRSYKGLLSVVKSAKQLSDETNEMSDKKSSTPRSNSRIKMLDSSTIAAIENITLPDEVADCVAKLENVKPLTVLNIMTIDDNVQDITIDGIESLDPESLEYATLAEVDDCESSSAIGEEIFEENEAELQMIEHDAHSDINDQKYEKLQQELDDMRKQLQDAVEAKDALTQLHNKLKQKNAKLAQECRQWQSTSEALRETLERQQHEASAEIVKQQENTISTSKECNCYNTEASPQAAAPQQTQVAALSKAQLFNGIKRYLSASMVSLMRMEMFGNAERPWKPDERRVSVDLLRLGENVYKYLTDEWRFRLPTLRQARLWLSNENNVALIDDEDDL